MREFEARISHSANQAILVSVALVGMGIAVGLADGSRPSLFGLAGALIAVAAMFVLRRQDRLAIGTALVFSVIVLVAARGSGTAWVDVALYAISLVILVVVGTRLAARVEDSLTLSELAWTSGGGRGALRMEVLARKELSRARRFERPLTVLSFALQSARRRGEVADAVRTLATALRCIDVIGYTGRNQFFVLLVETPPLGAIGALRRLATELEPPIARRLSAGIASFPEDNPTWNGLRTLALERMGPLDQLTLPGEAPVNGSEATTVNGGPDLRVSVNGDSARHG